MLGIRAAQGVYQQVTVIVIGADWISYVLPGLRVLGHFSTRTVRLVSLRKWILVGEFRRGIDAWRQRDWIRSPWSSCRDFQHSRCCQFSVIQIVRVDRRRPQAPTHIGRLRYVDCRRGLANRHPDFIGFDVLALGRVCEVIIHGPFPHPPDDEHSPVRVAERGYYLDAHLRLPLGHLHFPNVVRINDLDHHVQPCRQSSGTLAGTGHNGYRVRAFLLVVGLMACSEAQGACAVEGKET